MFLEGLNQPFGMALLGDTFYVGNADGVVAFPYTMGTRRITVPGRKLNDLEVRRPLDTQALLPSLDEQKLFIGVGSSEQYRRERHGMRGGPGGHP